MRTSNDPDIENVAAFALYGASSIRGNDAQALARRCYESAPILFMKSGG